MPDALSLRGSSESGSLPADGPGVSAIVDHAFVPRGAWYERCGWIYDDAYNPQVCGLAEAAHAATTVRRDARRDAR